MSLVSGTQTKYDINGIRESLSDVIYDITPHVTPFISMAGRGPKAKNTLEEWQTDALANVNTANAFLEGDETSYATPTPTVRVGNYSQISRKSARVTGTAESVNKAGRKSEMAYQVARRGLELRRDQEAIVLENQGGNAGGVGTARLLASLGAWVKTNVSKGTGGGNPAYTSGVPAAARTDSTSGNLRAFTETIAKAVIQSCYTAGGDPSVIMVGPVNKQRASGFSGIATKNIDVASASRKPMTVMGAADVYVSDFGTFRILPNRFQRERDAWFLDEDMFELRYLRPHFTEDMAKTGDATSKMILTEWTLVVKQEAGLGLAADLTTT